jgi:Lsr2
VAVPERSTPYEQACAVAATIEDCYPGSIPKLAEYLADGLPRGQAQADAYILATWGQLRPPRPKPQRTAPLRRRQLRATDPHPGSLLTPIGNPYRNPERAAEILRDYRCACGTAGTVTAVQAQVTSGNTRSCGCLQDQTRRQKRRSIPRAETQAAREWGRQNGMKIGSNGRLPDRILASYRLSQAGHARILDEDGLLEEQRVREWAQAHRRPLAARGKMPSDQWIDFVDDYLAQHEQN